MHPAAIVLRHIRFQQWIQFILQKNYVFIKDYRMNYSIHGLLWLAVHKLCHPDQTSRNAHFSQHNSLQGDIHNPCVLCFLCTKLGQEKGDTQQTFQYLVLRPATLRERFSETIVYPTSLLGGNLEINLLLHLPFVYFSLHCNLHSPIKLCIKKYWRLLLARTLNQLGLPPKSIAYTR